MAIDSTTHTTTIPTGFADAAEPPLKPGPKRRRLEAADAREGILAAAESLLVEGGPDALRLTEVALRAGVSHPNVLYHFGSVAELQSQLAQRIAERLALEVAGVFERTAGAQMPIDRAIGEVFRVFDEAGYARLIAWLEMSGNVPNFETLAKKLELLRSVITAHPLLRGEERESFRRRVVPIIELVIVAAIGHGIAGRLLDGLFTPEERRPSVSRVLGEMLVKINQ